MNDDAVMLVYLVPHPSLGERICIGAFFDAAGSPDRVFIPADRTIPSDLMGQVTAPFLAMLMEALPTVKRYENAVQRIGQHVEVGESRFFPADWNVGADNGLWLRTHLLPRDSRVG